MPKKVTYTVGFFLDPQPDDKQFGNVVSARLAAEKWAHVDRKSPIAVWKGDELDRLFFGGRELKQV